MNISTNIRNRSIPLGQLITTFILIVTFAILTPRTMTTIKAEPQKDLLAPLGCAVVVVVVGGIVVYGMWKICDKAFPKPPPPPTNGTPTNTNTIPPKSLSFPVPANWDPESLNYWTNFTMQVESSTNMANWEVVAYIEGFLGESNAKFITSDVHGIPMLTNVVPVDTMLWKGISHWVATNDIHNIVHEQLGEPKKFWRITP